MGWNYVRTTSLPLEPIITEAASQIMNDPSVDVLELLNFFTSTIKSVVLGGYREELIAVSAFASYYLYCQQYSLSMIFAAPYYYLEDNKNSAYIQSS